MERFLIAVAEDGVLLRRILGVSRDALSNEVRYATEPICGGELVDMLSAALAPEEQSYLQRFTEALVELGHLVTRLRWEHGATPWSTPGSTSSAKSVSKAIQLAPGTAATPSRPATARPAKTVTRRAARSTSAGLSANAPVFPASDWDDDED